MLRLAIVLLALPLGWHGPASVHQADRPDAEPPILSPVAVKVARTVNIGLGHSLGAAEAKSRTSARFAALQAKYADKVTASGMIWTGNDAEVRVTAYGQVTTAQVRVRDTSWDVRVNLPVVLSPLAGTIESFLRQTANETLKS